MRILVALAMLLFASIASAATLTWQDNATNEAGTHIYRATKACAPIPADAEFTKIGEVGPNVVSYVDATTQPGNKYCYKVRAWNLQYPTDPQSAQYSAYSNLAEMSYPLAIPAAPSQLGAVP